MNHQFQLKYLSNQRKIRFDCHVYCYSVFTTRHISHGWTCTSADSMATAYSAVKTTPHQNTVIWSIECLSCSSAYWNIYQTKDKYCSTNMFIFYSVRTTMTNMTRTEIHVCWLHGNHTFSCESNVTTPTPPLVHSWQPNTRLMGVLWNPFVIHWGCYYHHVNIKCVCNKLTRHSCVTYI